MACSSSCPSPDAAALNCKFGCPGVRVESGKGGLPKVCLCVDGSVAEVYLHGACITSWKPVGAATDLLFVRPDNDFKPPKPISGGIPHCFPQFGPGKIQQVVLWPTKLNTHITVQNTDSKPFEFSTALHSYFRAAISGVQVKGLQGCRFLTKDKVPLKGCERRDSITFTGFYDCLYFNAPNSLQLDNGLGTTIGIHNHGWTDAVLWSPMDQIASWREFVCVENAVLDPVSLCPCGTWSAEQILCLTDYPSQHVSSLRTSKSCSSLSC
ncbi:hypothetical protein M758_6G127200 [Ceratodon purpureus]|uniref:Glucose-6-phosphate 1-epimerase n=1 Tax=Ceratodon purpureus TaxID=3225 RepID=A0A8T0HIV2_CERPU|nr:hypothetical protein KC19_6G132400 [Ceratodon purpureus]KAG0613748.1 hypothetical protein M758_6G127200 [Ceratodon purpureus]